MWDLLGGLRDMQGRSAHRRPPGSRSQIVRVAAMTALVALLAPLGVTVGTSPAWGTEGGQAAQGTAAAEADDDGPDGDVQTGYAAPGSAPEEAGAAESSARTAALEEAAQTGQPVEIVAERGESRETYATPTGEIEVVEFVVPRWTRGDAGWARVDTTLEQTPAGIVPVASTADVVFSRGGDGPLVTVTRDGRTLEWTWPATLPEPTLEGDTATYGEVLPGVDLQMTAAEDGFASFVVVKTPEAAASPELDAITLGMRTEGLDVAVTGEGALDVTDQGSGTLVFTAPPAAMWSAMPSADGDSAHAAATGTISAVSGAGDGEHAPVEVQVSAEQDAVTLVPDQEMLEDPSTTFPVTIDPRVLTPNRSAWTSVAQDYPTNAYWKFSDTRGVGTCYGWVGCPQNGAYRLFYQFDVSKFKGKDIASAVFSVRNTHSAQCVNHPVNVYHTKGITSSTNWNTQAASGFFKKFIVTREFNYGGGQSACGNSGLGEFPIATLVQEGADANWNQLTLGLRASESDPYQWKKFSSEASLRVVYNAPPRQVSRSALSLKYGGQCTDTTGSEPVRIRTIDGNIMRVASGAAKDPDAEPVRVQFRLERADGTEIETLTSNWGSSGSYFASSVPASKIPANAVIRWMVRVQDRKLDGSGAYSSSPWSSPGCFFVVDTTMPRPPVITSENGFYPEPDPSDPNDMPHDGVGRYEWFIIDSSSSDVVRYTFQFRGGPVEERTGGSVKTAYLPMDPGDHRLTATAYDAAGNKATTEYDFRVNYGRNPVGNWTFDDPVDGAQAPSGYSLAGDASVATGLSEQDAAEGAALSLDGSGDWAEGSGGVVNTATHFAVEAWVRPESVDDTMNFVVSQPGVHQQGFRLYYAGQDGKWAFSQHEADEPGATGARALNDAPVRLGKWAHLLGVYDAYRNTLVLYVNGVPGPVRSFSTSWNSAGPVMIGASRFGSGPEGHFFDGMIDAVRTYNRVVTPREAEALATRIPKVAGRWMFEQAGVAQGDTAISTPNALVDSAGKPVVPKLYLEGGADRSSSFDGKVDEYALTLDGIDAHASTDLDVVPIATDESFTVAGWVRGVGDLDSNRTVWSLTGSVEEAVQLRYRPGTGTEESTGGSWQLVVREQNSTSGTVYTATADAPFVGEWTHVAVVYDAPRQVAHLYVNGVLSEDESSTEPGTAAFTGVRRFSLGRGLSSSAWGEYWPGGLDDVWMFRGALNQAQVEYLNRGLWDAPTVVPGAAQ